MRDQKIREALDLRIWADRERTIENLAAQGADMEQRKEEKAAMALSCSAGKDTVLCICLRRFWRGAGSHRRRKYLEGTIEQGPARPMMRPLATFSFFIF